MAQRDCLGVGGCKGRGGGGVSSWRVRTEAGGDGQPKMMKRRRPGRGPPRGWRITDRRRESGWPVTTYSRICEQAWRRGRASNSTLDTDSWDPGSMPIDVATMSLCLETVADAHQHGRKPSGPVLPHRAPARTQPWLLLATSRRGMAIRHSARVGDACFPASCIAPWELERRKTEVAATRSTRGEPGLWRRGEGLGDD